jgi:hypothetical protein
VATVSSKNRERRRASKQKKTRDEERRRARSGRGPESRPEAGQQAGPFGQADSVQQTRHIVSSLVSEAVHALHSKDDETAWMLCATLAKGVDTGIGPRLGHRTVDATLFWALQHELSSVWNRGWQPADVLRAAQRDYGTRHRRIATDVIAAEIRKYAPATVDEQWEAQLLEVDATVWWTRDDCYLTELAAREELDRLQVVRCLMEVMHVFGSCPPIQVLCPPPGRARRGTLGAKATAGRTTDPRQLDRVRALLAKAESTNYPEEAEAYTAKAQELMARHSIDYALLSAEVGNHDKPVGRRIGVDNPYEAPKVLLLDAVASANHCRTVWSKAFGFVTVMGFPSDLAAVEMLFTSLLVQGTSAMLRAGTRRDRSGRSTTRSFRQSFLTAYAQRIGERLEAATRQATEQASQELSGRPEADRLLPVLASRQSEVRTVTDQMFPGLVSHRVAASNQEGWASGRAAADQAQLATSQALPKPR